jgi:hypothetical protein
MGITSTWEDCAVVGTAGSSERLYFVNGSGELLVGTRQDSGAIKYEDVFKPGGGSTIPGIDFHSYYRGHLCSTSQFVAKSRNRALKWDRIGIDFSGAAFYDVASVGEKDVNVVAGNGIVYRYDGFRWTPHVIDDDRQAILGIDRDGEDGLASGAGGKVFERQSAGQWTQYQTPSEAALNGAVRGSTYDVAIGNGGTIVERERGGSTSESVGTPSTSSSETALSDEKFTVENHVEGEWV